MLTSEMKARLKLFLADDLGQGDVTSALVPSQNCIAIIHAKENCTLAGLDELTYLFSLKKCKTKLFAKDGQIIKKGKIIAEIKGNNRAILGIERTALNIVSRMSAVATACTQARKLIGKSSVQIALTRKTLPGFNLFDKKSAVLAGVFPHRLNLSSGILVKDNHLKFFNSTLEATLAVKSKRKGKRVELEVENEQEALDAVLGGAEIIMLDNFSVTQARKTIQWIRRLNPATKIEVSGGITFNNLKAYSKLEPDFISLGSLTHSVKGINFSLEIKKSNIKLNEIKK